MEKLIQLFVNSMIADGKSECTIKAYTSDLKGFADYLSRTGKTISEIKYSDMREWTSHMNARGLSATSRARKIATVKSFFRFLEKMDYIDKNPATSLESPKIPKKQPKVISTAEAKNLLTCTGRDDSWHITSFRDYTILAVFLFTGVRREELTNIKLSDVDLGNGTILIHGKGNKERTAYINATLHAVLSEYLMTYRKLFKTAENSKYLFPSIKNDQISTHAVNNVVNKAMESAGIKEVGISAHILRKWFATSVFEGTKDIATTSKLLGHSSPTVTMRYVRIDENTMRNATNVVSV